MAFAPLTLPLRKKHYSLPILQIPISLSQLRSKVDEMTPEQQIILRRNRESVAHECARVECERTRHTTRNTRVLSDPWVRNISDRINHKGAAQLSQTAYISGSFWVSITAAIGMPKLETGPQKSVWDRSIVFQKVLVPA